MKPKNPPTGEADMVRFAHFLRAKHPHNTPDLVAAETGVLPGTVRNWIQQRNRVSIDHLIALLDVYGPDVLIALWPGDVPFWLHDQAISREETELSERLVALAARRDALRAARAQRRIVMTGED